MVEVLTSKSSKGPSLDWLNPNLGYVRTSHAREKIRQWFRKQERADNIERGRAILERELRRQGMALSEFNDDMLRALGHESMDDFLAALGSGMISAHHLALKLAAFSEPEEEPGAPEGTPRALAPVVDTSVTVLGIGDVLTQIARCCNPVPGDPIIGYVTRSRGVTVHRRDCHNILHEDETERLIEVDWGMGQQRYPVSVRIEAWDRVGLLRDISTLVAEERVNMVGVRTQEHGDRTTSVYITLETTGIEQLTRLLNKLETVRGVLSVSRTRGEAVRTDG
jgi:GTP pyrophosphokinase